MNATTCFEAVSNLLQDRYIFRKRGLKALLPETVRMSRIA